ncbi:SCN1A [Symbiodinium natans]|uniref:SCN1A protein n=1 Tax=Symbiodinium natans TaxID=878477 RepID=A0A812PBR5_9DINO|nr:SCN1A [Symbiodinium natans]
MAAPSRDDSQPSLPSLPVTVASALDRSPLGSGEYSNPVDGHGSQTSAEKDSPCPSYHQTSMEYHQSSMESPGFRKRAAGGISSNFIKAKQVDEMSNHSSYTGKVRAFTLKLLQSTRFANFMALIVLFDASSLIVDIDARAAGESPPEVLMLMSDLCLAMYTAELVLLIMLRGWQKLLEWLVMVDAIIVGCGYAELIAGNFLASDNQGSVSVFGMLRVLRLARIIRLVRLLRKAPRLRELQKLVTMMATCLKALAWSFVFCFVIMTIWAMLLVEWVGPLIKKLMEDPEHELWQRCGQECQLLTSTVMNANVLLFKTVIAGDSWGLIAVPVIQEYPATAIIFMGSLLTLVFGVLNLIVAVVVDTFAEARERDVLNLAEEMERNHENDKKFLQKVFERIDEDGSGELTLEELVEGARKDPEFQSRLRVMDIDEVDLQQLFEMIDVDGSGAIEAAEFIAPLSRWVHDSKTAPRFIKYNMLRSMQQQEEIYRQSQFHYNSLSVRMVA